MTEPLPPAACGAPGPCEICDAIEELAQEARHPAATCPWCAEKELPCPEGHLLHRADLRARAAMTSAVLAFGHLAGAAKDVWAASGEVNQALRHLREAEGRMGTWHQRLRHWLSTWRI